MQTNIRQAESKDFDRLEEILIQNNMLKCPEIDGKSAMKRIYEISGKYFLVAETKGSVIGFIRGCYDGSRAVIHELAIDKDYQRKGIGKKLINELAMILQRDGALSLSVTSDSNSEDYYKPLSFSDIEIKLLVSIDINKVIERTNSSN